MHCFDFAKMTYAIVLYSWSNISTYTFMCTKMYRVRVYTPQLQCWNYFVVLNWFVSSIKNIYTWENATLKLQTLLILTHSQPSFDPAFLRPKTFNYLVRLKMLIPTPSLLHKNYFKKACFNCKSQHALHNFAHYFQFWLRFFLQYHFSLQKLLS